MLRNVNIPTRCQVLGQLRKSHSWSRVVYDLMCWLLHLLIFGKEWISKAAIPQWLEGQ